MLQIQPQSNFPITRNIDNPTDSNLYYIRAYIYDGVDVDTLLDTVDLTDLGNQRFKKNWRTPVDKGGDGRYITIFTKVFTDSGYTAESDAFGRKETKYLIKETWNRVYSGYGGGGASIDYKKIAKTLRREIKKFPKTPKIPKVKKTDLRPVLRAIDKIELHPIVKTEKTDLRAIQVAIKGVRDEIKKMPVTEKVDLSPIMEKIGNIENYLISSTDKADIIKSIKKLRIEAKKKKKIIIEKKPEKRGGRYKALSLKEHRKLY